MRILINTTPPTNSGGVANHYKGLKNYWSEEVYYNYIGGRKGIPGFIILWYDLIKFIWKLITLKPEMVLLNPSLRESAIKRDSIFLRMNNFFGIKTIVFFHGWDQKLANKIANRPEKFVKIFNKSNKILVLASEFKKQLTKWGIRRPISLTTTKVDDSILSNFQMSEKNYGMTILFLARIEKSKGIFITLDTFKKIKAVLPEVKMIIAGNGSALPKAKKIINRNKIPDINFAGYIRGNKLIKTYQSSDLYILPSYGEGMPTSVLEAMAYGLPVLSRPVGGLVDFFENGKMGYLIDSFEPSDFAKKAIDILSNKGKLQNMGQYNYRYAKEHFYASYVAKSLEKEFKKTIFCN